MVSLTATRLFDTGASASVGRNSLQKAGALDLPTAPRVHPRPHPMASAGGRGMLSGVCQWRLAGKRAIAGVTHMLSMPSVRREEGQ